MLVKSIEIWQLRKKKFFHGGTPICANLNLTIMKRITFNQFAEKVQHLDTYELTLIREEDSYIEDGVNYWEAEVKTQDNFITTIFLKYLVDYGMNIQIINNKIIINNI